MLYPKEDSASASHLERGYQFPVDVDGILAERLANPVEFQHIQSPFAGLDPPDKRMLPSQPLRKFALRQSGLVAQGD